MKTADISKIKVVHVMKDGETRKTLRGIIPPASTGCYDVMNRILRTRERAEA